MGRVVGLLILIVLLSLTLGAVSAQDALCQAELEVMTTDEGVEFVRTPDACFKNLPDWSYELRYVEIDGLRQAYVDVGSGESGETILLLHGQPSWSYLYRKMIPALAAEGHRVIAMDHVGFGRSDKPIDPDYYTFLGHTNRLKTFIQALELEQGNLSIFVQDWGSLIGLYVVGTNPDWFDRVVVGNGFLPTYKEGTVPYDLPKNPLVTRQLFFTTITSIPEQQPEFYDAEGNVINPQMRNDNFGIWIDYARNDERFVASQILEAMTYFDLTDEELAAYDAPFPSRLAMGGPRAFPGLVNQLPGVTDIAWEGLGEFEKPFLTIWGGNDPGNLGRPETQQALLDHVPGTAGWNHVRLPEASHFLQDDQGEKIAHRINEFIAQATDLAAPRLLSAYFGLDNALPRSANGLCRGAMGQDGMPVIFSHPVDNNSLQPEDFAVITADGTIMTPFCVTLAPATDYGELRTVLLIGELGAAGDNPPVMVRVVGDILSGSGDPNAPSMTDAGAALNFIGQTVDVTPLEAGPFLVYAEQVAPDQWTRQTRGTACPTDGLVQVIRVAWAGGVTKPSGDEVDDLERRQYSIVLVDADGVKQTVTPFALADMGDGDNYHLLCLDTTGTPVSVTFAAGYLTDPNKDALNPETTVPAQDLRTARR